MRTLTLLTAFIITACSTLAGCSSTPPYTDSTASNAATVTNTTVGFFRYLGGDAHTRVVEVDGKRAPAFKTSFKLSPGSHEIGVSAQSDRGQSEGYLQYNFEANKLYRVTGDMSGAKTKLRLHEIHGNDHKVVKEERIDTKKPQVPIMVIM